MKSNMFYKTSFVVSQVAISLENRAHCTKTNFDLPVSKGAGGGWDSNNESESNLLHLSLSSTPPQSTPDNKFSSNDFDVIPRESSSQNFASSLPIVPIDVAPCRECTTLQLQLFQTNQQLETKLSQVTGILEQLNKT